MRCVVTSFGSAGDFLPTLALGAALGRRGHDVHFVANPFYQRHTRRAGLELVPAGEYYDLYQRLEQNPAYGDPANASALFNDLVSPNTEAIYRVIKELLRSTPVDLVVANDASFGAFWAAAEHGIASVAVHATPMVWMSREAPLVFGDRALPDRLTRLLTAAARPVLNWYVSRWLRPLARRMNVSLRDVSFSATEQMAALRLGLWSPLLRGPVSSDPANGTICGFTRSSTLGGIESELPREVEAFLAQGPAPIVVGLGSAYALIAGSVLSCIASACADIELRCLILGHPSGMAFPSNTLAVRYAPYDQVFPRAAAVVVHGGAGTTGEALRCGQPVIGVPFAYDQFGLCAAIEQLGVGVRVPLACRERADFAQLLARILSDDAMRRLAADTSRQFADERDGAELGADVIELFARSAGTTVGASRRHRPSRSG